MAKTIKESAPEDEAPSDGLTEPYEEDAQENTPPEPPIEKAEQQVEQNIPGNETPSDSEVFSIYLGPSIHGVLISGTIFAMDRKAALEKLQYALNDYPLIAGLVIQNDMLLESRMKLKNPGNLLYEQYKKLQASISKIKQGG